MSVKYTPGPWRHNETWGLIMAGNDVEVAACHAGRGGDAKANAALIAAAPDLLEALKSMTEAFKSGTDCVDPACECEGNEKPKAIVSQALAAIAKAERGAS